MKPQYAIPLFLLGAFCIDRALGLALDKVSDRVQAQVNPSGVASANWVLAQRDADIIIFGSSRAKHHFDPRVIDEQLATSTINAAVNARGIAYARMLQSELLRADTDVRLFILQLDLVELFEPARQRAVSMAPWYGRNPVVDEILEDSSRFAPIKLQSYAYRYNGKVLHLIQDMRKSSASPAKGYVALGGALSDIPPPLGRGALHFPNLGPIAEAAGSLHREFVRAARARGIEVALVLGPRLRRAEPEPDSQYAAAVAYFQAMAEVEGAHFIPLSDLEYPQFRAPEKYRDWLHLNHGGAVELSFLLAEELRLRGLPGRSPPGDSPNVGPR